jgi:hypothetical protein
MKKLFLLLTIVATNFTFGQWTSKTITSDFDGSFKKAYTQNSGSGRLIMESATEDYPHAPFFALSGSYFCDDTGDIDFVLVVGLEKKQYSFKATKSKDSRMYYFNENVWTEEFITDFKTASKCLIRVNQDYCTNDYYEFNMSGSAQAYNFLILR